MILDGTRKYPFRDAAFVCRFYAPQFKSSRVQGLSCNSFDPH
jgi:hypothetical protein